MVGVDASADQLRVARQRAGPVVAGLLQADGARLPFPAGSCPLVVSAFTHTDVEDFARRGSQSCREVIRVMSNVVVGLGGTTGDADPTPDQERSNTH